MEDYGRLLFVQGMEFAAVTETTAFLDVLIPGSYEGDQSHFLQRTVTNVRNMWLELVVGANDA